MSPGARQPGLWDALWSVAIVSGVVIAWLLGLYASWRLSNTITDSPHNLADRDRFAVLETALAGVTVVDFLVEPLPQDPDTPSRHLFEAQYVLTPTQLKLWLDRDSCLAGVERRVLDGGSAWLLVEQGDPERESALGPQLQDLAATHGLELRMERFPLTTGQLLLAHLARPGALAEQSAEPVSARRTGDPGSALAAWLVMVTIVAAGYLLAAAVTTGDTGTALAYAPAVGFGLLSVICFFHLLAGLAPPGPWWLLTIAALLWLALRYTRPQVDTAAKTHEPARRSRAVVGIGVLMLAVTLTGLGVASQQWRQARPHGCWDAIAIWNAHARLLYRAEPGSHGTLLQLQAQLQGAGHPDYPLLQPAAIAAQWSLLGEENQEAARATNVALMLGLAAMLLVSLTRAGAGSLTTATAALLLATPMLWRWGFSQYSDLLVAYLLLAAANGLAASLDRGVRRVSPLLTGVVLGLLPWAKMEGGLLALGLLSVTAAVSLLRRRRAVTLRSWSMLAIGALPGLAATLLHALCWAPAQELTRYLGASLLDRLVDPERWHAILQGLWLHLGPRSGIGLWGPFWGIALIAAVVLLRCRRAVYPQVLLAMAGLVLAIDVTFYLLSPYQLDWHLRTSLDRLLLQLLPLLGVALVSSLGRSLERGTESGGGQA